MYIVGALSITFYFSVCLMTVTLESFFFSLPSTCLFTSHLRLTITLEEDKICIFILIFQIEAMWLLRFQMVCLPLVPITT